MPKRWMSDFAHLRDGVHFTHEYAWDERQEEILVIENSATSHFSMIRLEDSSKLSPRINIGDI